MYFLYVVCNIRFFSKSTTIITFLLHRHCNRMKSNRNKVRSAGCAPDWPWRADTLEKPGASRGPLDFYPSGGLVFILPSTLSL